MTDNKNSGESSDTVFIFELFEIFMRWRRLLVVNTILAAIITLLIMILFFPNQYTASTSIMPPQKDTGGFGLGGGMLSSGLGALLGGSGMALPGLASPSDLYASVLRSRAVALSVIEKNNLKEIYDVDLEIKALDELHGRTVVNVQAEGIISVSYVDTDPQLASDVANSFIEELNRVNTENLASKAKATREFIEKRLNESILDLKAAEEDYEAFQKKNKMISLEDQVKASIEVIATLNGELTLAEIELGVMQKSLLPDNFRYKNQLFRIEEINKKIKDFEIGGKENGGKSGLNVILADAPELALKFVRLTRELKIQETIFELLKQQYEQAKIQEMRDTPTVQVLDPATPPELKSGPKRVFTAAFGGVLCFGLTLFFVLLMEFVQREKEKRSEIYRGINRLSNVLTEDLYWIRSLLRKGKNNYVD